MGLFRKKSDKKKAELKKFLRGRSLNQLNNNELNYALSLLDEITDAENKEISKEEARFNDMIEKDEKKIAKIDAKMKREEEKINKIFERIDGVFAPNEITEEEFNRIVYGNDSGSMKK